MRIFLGYASEHLETAREVYALLKSLNDEVWFDKEALIGGDDWDRERAEAQKIADFVVHLISKEVFSRPGVVNREIKQTLRLIEDQPIGASYAVFIRLDELRMPVELLRFQYIDYFSETWRDQLTQAVAKRLGQLGGTVLRIAPARTTTVKDDLSGSAVRGASPSKIETSVSTEFYSISAEYLQYPQGAVYWDFVNARLATEALGGFVHAVADFNQMDNYDKDRAKEYNAPHEWNYNMQEFFRHRDFLSVRSSVYFYTGGAHPNYAVTTLNFLGPEYGLCSINDLLGHDRDKAARLLEYCKNVLIAMFDEEGPKDFIYDTFQNEKYTWNLASQFNYDEKGLTVNFSPYDVLPFAFGSHEIFVPWRFAATLLDSKYEKLEEQLSN